MSALLGGGGGAGAGAGAGAGTGAGPGAGAVPRVARGWSLPSIPAPWLFSSLITLILVVGQWKYDIVGGYERLALALGTALAVELLLSRVVRGSWPNLLSAYITGNSIAILTKPGGGLLWPYALGAAVAIASKYVLTYRGRHLWNPTNFSISAFLLLAPHSMSVLSHQWGNEWAIVAIVFAVGSLVITRAKLWHITGTYVVAFALLAALRSAVKGSSVLFELAPLTGPMYILLIFFMLTDPRTVVSTRAGRIKVVLLIALLECAFRLLPSSEATKPLQAAPAILALAIVGPIAFWL
ncbi:MAG TPA: RnfABCDGE type electron transport complex subunit D, partial [Planctomycetota bacterium]|nr:RnfABCDGE type electron transport complex subunit D [Planctomycetota bacterium]